MWHVQLSGLPYIHFPMHNGLPVTSMFYSVNISGTILLRVLTSLKTKGNFCLRFETCSGYVRRRKHACYRKTTVQNVATERWWKMLNCFNLTFFLIRWWICFNVEVTHLLMAASPHMHIVHINLSWVGFYVVVKCFSSIISSVVEFEFIFAAAVLLHWWSLAHLWVFRLFKMQLQHQTSLPQIQGGDQHIRLPAVT